MTGVEALGILGGAICLTFPIWGVMILVAWLDRRPTPEQGAARTGGNVERRREQITRRGW